MAGVEKACELLLVCKERDFFMNNNNNNANKSEILSVEPHLGLDFNFVDLGAVSAIKIINHHVTIAGMRDSENMNLHTSDWALRVCNVEGGRNLQCWIIATLRHIATPGTLLMLWH